MHESEKWQWGRSVVSDSSRPHGLQPIGSSVHGIFQARILEWGAIAFSIKHINNLLKQILHCISKVFQGSFSLNQHQIRCIWNQLDPFLSFFLSFFFWCEPFLKFLLNSLQYFVCFMLWFTGLEACGFKVPWRGIKATTSAVEGEVFTTGEPDKPMDPFLKCVDKLQIL